MMRALLFTSLVWFILAEASSARGQSSSLWRAAGGYESAGTGPVGRVSGTAVSPDFAAAPPRPVQRTVTSTLEQVSLIAVPAVPARKFKVHDLITIIVRQHKRYEADGKLDTKKQWDLTGKLQDWFRFHPRGRLGQDRLTAGKPGFAFKYENELRTDGENEREDKFITRIQAAIVDVKPNGNLVLEATMTEEHDEERFTITVTGVCRSEDVTPENTILSTQIAQLTLLEKNEGAVRDSTRRGWIPKILDWVSPF